MITYRLPSGRPIDCKSMPTFVIVDGVKHRVAGLCHNADTNEETLELEPLDIQSSESQVTTESGMDAGLKERTQKRRRRGKTKKAETLDE